MGTNVQPDGGVSRLPGRPPWSSRRRRAGAHAGAVTPSEARSISSRARAVDVSGQTRSNAALSAAPISTASAVRYSQISTAIGAASGP